MLELLVVVMVTGVLTAIALPSLFRFVGKAREVEAKEGLSVIGFAQQGYHFENRVFSSSYPEMGIALSQNYYDFSVVSSSQSTAVSNAVPKNLGNDPYRAYSMGVYYDQGPGVFSMKLCQSPYGAVVSQAPASSSGICSNGGVNIQ
ncbi:general secretion pathway protein GspG [Synechocystis sp. FACHB-383]|uniref:type IV pilin protein n=1 Tax=Synechocystis sp. FACHB-383 TaxID=2692864 RepID=UPI0016849E76|nr:type IV pilin-like G/H family protein [Synechocystis sp. FACHB-383]MBD2654407.1 general secretion pathway protein GspG [Synechocystis sp. FACHB-383]